MAEGDYALICHEPCYLIHTTVHANGTHVVAIKKRKEPGSDDVPQSVIDELARQDSIVRRYRTPDAHDQEGEGQGCMRPDYVVSFQGSKTLHAAFDVARGITRVACRGARWYSLVQEWDYRYRGNGDDLCRHPACRAGFEELDAADRPPSASSRH